jgi:hypothetical protein
MNTEQMKDVLLQWNPWWNLSNKSDKQIAAIYERCLHETRDQAYNRYMSAAKNAMTLEAQADILIAYQKFERR